MYAPDLLLPDVKIVHTLTEQACKERGLNTLVLDCYRLALAGFGSSIGHNLNPTCVVTLPASSQTLFPRHNNNFFEIVWGDIYLKTQWSKSMDCPITFVFTTDEKVRYTFEFLFPNPQVYKRYLEVW